MGGPFSTGVEEMTQLQVNKGQLRRGRVSDVRGEVATCTGRRYQIEDQVGKGGNAGVYRCVDTITGELCAIKFPAYLSTKAEKRFEREIRLLRSLDSPHILPYVDSGRALIEKHENRDPHWIKFVITELAVENLQQAIVERGAPDYVRYAGQFRGLSAGLAAFHDHPERPIHRDIKPENILVTEDRWLLADYGLCSVIAGGGPEISVAGERIGPKFWLSPEAYVQRLCGVNTICAASDVFQLAAVFWYAVTGRHPTGVVTRDDWSGPDRLFGPIYRALQHDLERRPRNGSEFYEEIAAALMT